MNKKSATKEQLAAYYRRRGAPWQLLMIATFLYRRLEFYPANNYILVLVLTTIGIGIFTYCMYVLYAQRKATQSLITSGVFTYTRHPMYTAFVFMDSLAWFAPFSWQLLLSTILFYGCLILAAYWQEKETLARFGQAAQDYYDTTPRLFFWYPFRTKK